MPARKAAVARPEKNKSLESWIWDAACSIRRAKRLGLADVEADIIGKSYEYLIRKFAEGGGQSAGEWSGATWTLPKERPKGERGGAHQFYTPGEVGEIMARVLDPTCGSGGLKCEIAIEAKVAQAFLPVDGMRRNRVASVPLKRYQEYVAETWAIANMNMIIHDMEGQIEIGDTFKNSKFRDKRGKLRTFDRVVANPMWNQDWFTKAYYDADKLDRFAIN